MCLIRDKTIRKKRNTIIYGHRGREDRKHANDIVGNHDVKIDTITKKISQPRDLQCKSLVIHEGRKKQYTIIKENTQKVKENNAIGNYGVKMGKNTKEQAVRNQTA